MISTNFFKISGCNVKSWKQHPTKQQQYGRPSPILKTILVKRTKQCGTLLEKLGRTHE